MGTREETGSQPIQAFGQFLNGLKPPITSWGFACTKASTHP
jgi:hypothetical protein